MATEYFIRLDNCDDKDVLDHWPSCLQVNHYGSQEQIFQAYRCTASELGVTEAVHVGALLPFEIASSMSKFSASKDSAENDRAIVGGEKIFMTEALKRGRRLSRLRKLRSKRLTDDQR